MNKENIIKVAALTNAIHTPSSRFRVRQYISLLAEEGIEVSELIPRYGTSCGLPSPFKMAARIPAFWRSRDADIVWLSRHMVQGYAFFERCLKRLRVLDVDDAVWMNPPFGRFAQPWIARGMDAVIAGNQYLANYYSRYCDNVHIIPTAIDLDRYQKHQHPETEPEKFTLVWTGLACNYKYLKPIENVLGQFLRDHGRAELLLIANRPWKMELPKDRVRFIPWSPEIEASALQGASVGIMPLTDGPWTRGKCSFKMLQYMAIGLPVIVSPVGMNGDILNQGQIGFGPKTNDQWHDALKALYNDWALQKQMGTTAREIIETTYSTKIISKKLAALFKSLV
jgi:glycosyltransferase involved in cell wall biosynthesis